MTEQIIADATALASDIRNAIRTAVIERAFAIDKFHERHAELTETNDNNLFLYATALVIYWTAKAKAWTADIIVQAAERMSEDLGRRARFGNPEISDGPKMVEWLGNRLVDMFGEIDGVVKRLSKTSEEDGERAAYFLLMPYLLDVYPGARAMMIADRDTLASVVQSFGQLSLAGFVSLPSPR